MEVTTVLKESELDSLLIEFETNQSQNNPTFNMPRQYMKMMAILLLLIRSVRAGNWNLHTCMVALEDFTKYFVALDLNNYSSVIALYLAEMASLKVSDPDSCRWNGRNPGTCKSKQCMKLCRTCRSICDEN